jgi:Leucine-rich repeat (LRR) protein
VHALPRHKGAPACAVHTAELLTHVSVTVTVDHGEGLHAWVVRPAARACAEPPGARAAQAEGGGGLVGTLPSFEGAPALRHLHLGGNRFSGGLPALPAGLETLLLQRNELSGPIPARYAALPLRVLSLEHNSLTGRLPPGARTLPCLR